MNNMFPELNEVFNNIMALTYGKNVVYTHAGVFHTDDAMATALLRIAGYEGDVVRVNKVPEGVTDETNLIYDIGYGRFDHHQDDVDVRPSGVKYAAFGLLVRVSGLCEVDGFYDFDQTFVEFLDKTDNGQLGKDEVNNIRNYIFSLNPRWDEDTDEHVAFQQAVSFCTRVLEREFGLRLSKVRARSFVNEAVDKALEQNKHYIDLDRFMPWEGQIKYLDGAALNVLCAVYPSRGEWAIKIRSAFDLDHPRQSAAYFDFVDANKPEGCTFVHSAGFIASAKTHEAAIDIAERYVHAIPSTTLAEFQI